MPSALDTHVAKALGEAESIFTEIMDELQKQIDALEEKQGERETAARAAKIDVLASKRDMIEVILDAIDAASAEFADG